MILPDVNVLIYAFRPTAPEHDLCRRWLVSLIAGASPFGMSPLALAAVVRITTGTRVFLDRTPIDEAFAFCANLLSQPHCRIVEPGPGHWEIFRALCIGTQTGGRRVTDAWYAALAIESGCEWITLDRDFARFPGLRWRTPDAP